MSKSASNSIFFVLRENGEASDVFLIKHDLASHISGHKLNGQMKYHLAILITVKCLKYWLFCYFVFSTAIFTFSKN